MPGCYRTKSSASTLNKFSGTQVFILSHSAPLGLFTTVMKAKYIALACILAGVSSLHAAQVEMSYYATFMAKLSLEGDKVYVDCPTLSVVDKSGEHEKLIPVKHVLAYNIHDPNYEGLKMAAAQDKTEKVNGRFEVDKGILVFLIANSKGKR